MTSVSNNYKNPLSMKSVGPEESYIHNITLCISNKKEVIEHLDLNKYKTIRCEKEVPCRNIKTCPYFHNGDDFRRDLSKIPYTSELCQFGKHCLIKMNCELSHNKYESNYHPEKYKMKYCKHILEINRCKYGKFCYNAHNDQDLKIALLHTMRRDDDFFIFKFKTEFCPFQMEHNIKNCIYAHSWEDHRRDILKSPYSNNICQRWFENPFGKLEDRCSKGLNCPQCHGRYESDFHPLNFKKYPCQFPNCSQKVCPFVHIEESMRFKGLEQKKDFFIFPYNRITPGTFIESKSFFKSKSPNII